MPRPTTFPWLPILAAAALGATAPACISPCGSYDGCSPWFTGVSVSGDDVLEVDGSGDTGALPPTLRLTVADSAYGTTRSVEAQLEPASGGGFQLAGSLDSDWDEPTPDGGNYCPEDVLVTFELVDWEETDTGSAADFPPVDVEYAPPEVELWNGWTLSIAWGSAMC